MIRIAPNIAVGLRDVRPRAHAFRVIVALSSITMRGGTSETGIPFLKLPTSTGSRKECRSFHVKSVGWPATGQPVANSNTLGTSAEFAGLLHSHPDNKQRALCQKAWSDSIHSCEPVVRSRNAISRPPLARAYLGAPGSFVHRDHVERATAGVAAKYARGARTRDNDEPAPPRMTDRYR